MDAPDENNNRQSPGEVTRLLQNWADGDKSALEALWPMVYDDVRRLARRQMSGERGDHTLQSTAGERGSSGQASACSRAEPRAVPSLAAQIMRRAVDYARQRGAQRRGDGAGN